MMMMMMDECHHLSSSSFQRQRVTPHHVLLQRVALLGCHFRSQLHTRVFVMDASLLAVQRAVMVYAVDK